MEPVTSASLSSLVIELIAQNEKRAELLRYLLHEAQKFDLRYRNNSDGLDAS